MQRRHAWLVIALVGCKPAADRPAAGSGSAPPPAPIAGADGSARAPTAADAAVDGDVAVQQRMVSAGDAALDAVYAALVSRADGRCPADAVRTSRNTRASAAATIGTDTVVAMSCGDPDQDRGDWTVGIVRYDGLTARALAVKHVTAGDVVVDFYLRASAARVCVDYGTIDARTMIKGLELCAPRDADQLVVASDADPTVPADLLPRRTRTDDEHAGASVALVEEVVTCSAAVRPFTPGYHAALDGAVLTIAATCGDLAARRGAVGLYQRPEGQPGRLLGYTVQEGDDLVPTGIRADAALVCVDYVTKPEGSTSVFCVRRRR